MDKSVMGIDPGANGGVAIISNKREIVHVYSMPEMNWYEFECVCRSANVGHIFLEKVHAMPGQGVTSMFTFGEGYGRIKGWIEALTMPMTLVTPQRWQKIIHQGCSGDKPKIKTLQAIRQLYPGQSLLDPTKPKSSKAHDGIADAVGIADFGWRELGGLNAGR